MRFCMYSNIVSISTNQIRLVDLVGLQEGLTQALTLQSSYLVKYDITETECF